MLVTHKVNVYMEISKRKTMAFEKSIGVITACVVASSDILLRTSAEYWEYVPLELRFKMLVA